MKRFSTALLTLAVFCSAMAAGNSARAASTSRKAQLGRKLFLDTNLSTPPGQSCGGCHNPAVFFVDPDKALPTSEGALPELKGSRNTPIAMYTAFIPAFHFDKAEGLFVGGQFLDGRAATLKEQAKGPFVNPLEMANPNEAAVVEKVRRADYARLFEQVYGKRAFDDPKQAFDRIADAIAAFERTPSFAPFSSKYDYYLVGKARFTAQERRGRQVYEDPDKGNCAACHPDRPAEGGTPPLFTDHTYDNLGVPKNPDNPFYALPRDLNPDGFDFVDQGLGGFVKESSENGKFKVQTLRNIAKTAPYMHNGYFKTLRGVVDFYNSRDIKPACMNPMTAETEALAQACWPAAEVAENVNHDELGALGLSEREMGDLIAFLNTLTDGYRPER